MLVALQRIWVHQPSFQSLILSEEMCKPKSLELHTADPTLSHKSHAFANNWVSTARIYSTVCIAQD